MRAEGAAVVATSGDDLRTVFTHDISPQTNWRAIFDADAVVRALNGATVGSAVAAGRWDEQAAFALLTRIDLPDGEALLCALRHGVPFDAVELSTASSAAELLAMSVGDGRAMERKRRADQRRRPLVRVGNAEAAQIHGRQLEQHMARRPPIGFGRRPGIACRGTQDTRHLGRLGREGVARGRRGNERPGQEVGCGKARAFGHGAPTCSRKITAQVTRRSAWGG